jgi:hypothetical protein
MPKKAEGTYTGIYSYSHLQWEDSDRLGGLVIYTSKDNEGFGTYELTLEKFVELKRPEKIKVVDTIEVIK